MFTLIVPEVQMSGVHGDVDLVDAALFILGYSLKRPTLISLFV